MFSWHIAYVNCVLKLHAHGDLQRSRIPDGCDLIEGRRRICRIDARSEVRVAREIVAAIRHVECLQHAFAAYAAHYSERTAHSEIQTEKVGADARIPFDERAVHNRAAGCSLNRCQA